MKANPASPQHPTDIPTPKLSSAAQKYEAGQDLEESGEDESCDSSGNAAAMEEDDDDPFGPTSQHSPNKLQPSGPTNSNPLASPRPSPISTKSSPACRSPPLQKAKMMSVSPPLQKAEPMPASPHPTSAKPSPAIRSPPRQKARAMPVASSPAIQPPPGQKASGIRRWPASVAHQGLESGLSVGAAEPAPKPGPADSKSSEALAADDGLEIRRWPANIVFTCSTCERPWYDNQTFHLKLNCQSCSADLCVWCPICRCGHTQTHPPDPAWADLKGLPTSGTGVLQAIPDFPHAELQEIRNQIQEIASRASPPSPETQQLLGNLVRAEELAMGPEVPPPQPLSEDFSGKCAGCLRPWDDLMLLDPDYLHPDPRRRGCMKCGTPMCRDCSDFETGEFKYCLRCVPPQFPAPRIGTPPLATPSPPVPQCFTPVDRDGQFYRPIQQGPVPPLNVPNESPSTPLKRPTGNPATPQYSPTTPGQTATPNSPTAMAPKAQDELLPRAKPPSLDRPGTALIALASTSTPKAASIAKPNLSGKKLRS